MRKAELLARDASDDGMVFCGGEEDRWPVSMLAMLGSLIRYEISYCSKEYILIKNAG